MSIKLFLIISVNHIGFYTIWFNISRYTRSHEYTYCWSRKSAYSCKSTGVYRKSKFAFGQSITNWYSNHRYCCPKRNKYSSCTYPDALEKLQIPLFNFIWVKWKRKSSHDWCSSLKFSISKMWDHKPSPFISDWWVYWVGYYRAS